MKWKWTLRKCFQISRCSLWIFQLRNCLVKTIYPFLSPIYLILVNTIIQLHLYSYLLPQVSKHFRQDFHHDLASFPLQTVNFAQSDRESLTQFANCLNERNSTLNEFFKFSQQLKQRQNKNSSFPSVDLVCFLLHSVVYIFYLLVHVIDVAY